MGLAGFDMKRRVVSPALCAVLRQDALAAMAAECKQATSLAGRLGRLARGALRLVADQLVAPERGRILEPKNRAHVRLGMTLEVRAALCAALGPGGLLRLSMLDAGLTPAAQLVELSVMIVMPGAIAQCAHADVAPHINHPMATMWVALQVSALSTLVFVVCIGLCCGKNLYCAAGCAYEPRPDDGSLDQRPPAVRARALELQAARCAAGATDDHLRPGRFTGGTACRRTC